MKRRFVEWEGGGVRNIYSCKFTHLSHLQTNRSYSDSDLRSTATLVKLALRPKVSNLRLSLI